MSGIGTYVGQNVGENTGSSGQSLLDAPNIFYSENFDTGSWIRSTVNPIWQIDLSVTNDTYGAGNLWEIDSSSSYSGLYSLKTDYGARNRINNRSIRTPSPNIAFHYPTGFDNSTTQFISHNGTDMSVMAPVGYIIWNKNNKWSRWVVDSHSTTFSTNDTCNVTLLDGAIDSSTSEFNGNDEIVVSTNTPGTDDRAECDLCIEWINTNSVLVDYGQSIFRRIYFMPNVITAPNRQKMMYFRDSANDNLIIGAEYAPPTHGSDVHLYITYPRSGGVFIVRKDSLVNGTWYYLEVEYKNESFSGAGDAECRVWFSEAGLESDTPIHDSVAIGPSMSMFSIDRVSIWGNYQHNVDCIGSYNIDSIVFSDTKIGAE